MSTLDLEECVKDARRAALLAWARIHHFYKGKYDITEKADGPATEADVLADRTILAYLQERYPLDRFGYLSEELAQGQERRDQQYCWIIDPIDGTNDFIAGRKDFAVQIGLVGADTPGGDQVPLVAIVYQPIADVLYCATAGRGAFAEEVPVAEVVGKDGDVPFPPLKRRLRVSAQKRLEKAHTVITRSHPGKKLTAAIDHLRISRVTSLGSLGVKVAEVATSRADLYLNTSHRRCKEWDVCAPQLILTEAGGMLTDLQGNPITYNKEDVYVGHGVLASNGVLHEETVRLLGELEILWERPQ